MPKADLSTVILKTQIQDMLKCELLLRPAIDDPIIPADALLLHVAPFISNSVVYDKEFIANVFKKDEYVDKFINDKESIANVFKKDGYVNKFINESERQIFVELLFALLNERKDISFTIPEAGFFRGVSLKELKISLKPGVTLLSKIIDDKLIQTTIEDRNDVSINCVSMLALKYRDLISCIFLLLFVIGALILKLNSASFASPLIIDPANFLFLNFFNSVRFLQGKEAVPGAQFFMKKEDEEKRINLLAFHDKYRLAPEIASGTDNSSTSLLVGYGTM